MRLLVKPSSRAAISCEGPTAGGVPFHAHSHGCWQASDPHWLLDLSIGLVTTQKLASLSMHDQRRMAKVRERGPKTEATVYNCISKVTSYPFCPILFITSELVSPAHTPGKGLIIQGRGYQEAGILRAILEAAYHIQINDCWSVRLFPYVTAFVPPDLAPLSFKKTKSTDLSCHLGMKASWK